MSSATDTISFKKGEIIFKEGRYEACMYDIGEGTVGIYVNYGTANEKNLAMLGPGEYFGEMGLIEGYPRSATAVAVTDCKLYRIDSDSFGSYFREKPAKILGIMEHMSHRLRELTNDYMEACQTIAEYLHAEEAKQPKSEGLLAKMRKFMNIYEGSRR